MQRRSFIASAIALLGLGSTVSVAKPAHDPRLCNHPLLDEPCRYPVDQIKYPERTNFYDDRPRLIAFRQEMDWPKPGEIITFQCERGKRVMIVSEVVPSDMVARSA